MKRIFTSLFLLLLTLSTFQNLTAQTCTDGSYQWSDMATIFESNGCASASCHGGNSGGLDLTTYSGFSAGGTKCGTEIFDGTNLVDIIQVGASCGDTGGGAGGSLGAMINFTGMPVSDADISAIQTYIDAGAFEFCPGTPLDDGICDPPTTIGSLTVSAQSNLCSDGSNPVTIAAPSGSLPDVQIVVEVNGSLITITDDGSFDTSILMEGDQVCFTAFTFDLEAINALLTTASQLCPILNCDNTFDLEGVNQAISDLVLGINDGEPGLNDLQEALDFAGSFGNPIASVQTAGSTLDALNVQIGALLGNVCYASSESVCLSVESCGPCSGEEVEVTFSVDMSCSGTDARPPVVTGPFNDFSGDGNIMIDPDGDDIWEAVICAMPGTEFEYKYAIQDFVEQEDLVDDAIGGANGVTCNLNTNFFDFSNRLITIPDGGGALATDAYGSCGTCADPPVTVTFSIDMNCSDVAPGTQVAMFGGFNGFCCPFNLEDTDGDNVWTTTLPFPTDETGCISMQYLYMAPDFGNVESFLTALSTEEIGECPTLISDYYGFANRVVDACEDVVLDDHWESCSARTEPAEGCDDGDCTNGTETWDGCACVSGDPTGVLGCTDSAFCEYNPDADCDDGSCVTSNADPGTCNTDCTAGDTEVWDAATCSCVTDVVTVLGCNNAAACNFNPDANCDDGSCDLGNTACADPCNEPDPDDGCDLTTDSFDAATCTVTNEPNCDSGTTFNAGTCNCDTDIIMGCTDACADNYDPMANEDDGSCTPYDATCNEDCTVGAFGGTWDVSSCSCINETTPVNGCTDNNACNYNPDANCDDGSCDLGNTACTDSCNEPDPDDGCDLTTDSFDAATCTVTNEPNCDSGTTFNAGTCNCDTDIIMGCTDTCADNYDPTANEDDGSCTPYDATCNDDCIAGPFGGTWDADSCSCINETTPVNGCTDATAENYNPDANCEDNTCVFDTTVEGCTDPCAPNFNSEANVDDDTCEAYDTTCNSDCTMGDITVWDAATCSCEIETMVILGCTDTAAINYDSTANCNSGCEFESCVPPTPGVIEDCGFGLSQERLDAIATLVVSETGGSFPHGGMNLTADQTIRDIFSSDGNVVEEVNPGLLITKHTYAVDESGNRGDLLVTFAMFKHAQGYWADSNDWEYIMIPADPTVDYTINPNGILSNAAVSGNVHDTNPGCVGCHNGAGGGDQLFSND